MIDERRNLLDVMKILLYLKSRPQFVPKFIIRQFINYFLALRGVRINSSTRSDLSILEVAKLRHLPCSQH